MAAQKILIVSQHFWPENFRINDFALELKKQGHEVTILTGLPNYPKGSLYANYKFLKGPYRETWNDISIVRSFLVTRGQKKSLRLILNYLSFPFFGSLVALWSLRKQSFDKIFVHQTSPVFMGIPAALLKIFRKIPVYFWVLDLWPDTLASMEIATSESLVYRMTDRLTRWLYKISDQVLVPSQRIFDALVESGHPKEKLTFFPYWAEDVFLETKFSPEEELKVQKLMPKSGFSALFAGNLGQAQDLGNLIQAMALVPKECPVQLVFVGDGHSRKDMERLVRELGLESRVFFLGPYPLGFMPIFYKYAQALIVSLAKDPLFTMTIPSKIQGYMAAGKPVLAVLDGEGADVVQRAECGLSVSPGDPQTLAQSLQRLAELPDGDLDSMGRRGAEFYKSHYSKSLAIARFHSLSPETQP